MAIIGSIFSFILGIVFQIGLIVSVIKFVGRSEKDIATSQIIINELITFLLLSSIFILISLGLNRLGMNDQVFAFGQLLSVGAAGLIAYRFGSPISLFVFATSLPVWWALIADSFGVDNGAITSIAGIIFVIYFLIDEFLQKKKQKLGAAIFGSIAYIAVFALLYSFSFTNLSESIFAEGTRPMMAGAVFLVLMLLIQLYFSEEIGFKGKLGPFNWGFVVISAFFLFPLLLNQSPVASAQDLSQTASNSALLYSVVSSMLIFIFPAAMGYYGFLVERNYYINLSILFVFMAIIGKYFDWFSTFLQGSFFFISLGIVFIAAGSLLEKFRRNIMKEINK